MKSKKVVIVAIALLILCNALYLRFFSSSNQNTTQENVVSPAYLPVPGIMQGPIVSFNFDDGYTSALTKGMPILEAAGFKSTHYIVQNRIAEWGYMNHDEILDLQTRGHEIGAHSLTHTILTEIPIESARKEVFGPIEELHKMGIVKIATFSYPEGYFNDAIVALVKEAGYVGARITNPGLNDAGTDPYRLLYVGMNAEMSLETAKQKIDEAIAKKKWIILVFHKVDESGYENVTSDFLQKIVDYVKEKNVPVVTTAQGLLMIKNIPQ